MEDILFKRLTEKRDEIRARDAGGGRRGQVCSDFSLEELARLQPKNKEELMYVPGLGKAFSEKYGDEFMAVLDAYRRSHKAEKEAMLPKVRERLMNLENRLVNINRRNRLLYMPKLSPKYTVDLVDKEDGGYKLLDFLKRQDGETKMKLLDLARGERAENEKRLTQFKRLQREVERDKRESAQSSLCVGYPFVCGRMSGEDFNVRAPLALFPVRLSFTDSAVFLHLDGNKDAVYNSALILSQIKFSGKNGTVENNVIEEIKPSKFIDELIEFYASYGIKIEPSEKSGIRKFRQYAAAEFPKFASGEFRLEENAVLGRFSLYSSALQQDFRQIIESDEISELLAELLRSSDDEDIYADSDRLGDTPVITPPKESGLAYINDLNGAQENAIGNVNGNNRLVVQGPPGTGKSQVITSMIADFAVKGKTVLMVSQKKAALDVIYSRLGEESRYAVMIGDSKDKDAFYDSLSRLFSVPEPKDTGDERFYSASARIDDAVARLDAIAEKLYYEEPYGAPMYRIYEETVGNGFAFARADRLAAFSGNICLELCGLGYEEIKEACAYFDNEKLLETCREYYDLVGEYQWLEFTRSDFTAMDATLISQEIERLIDAYVAYRGKNVFARFFLRGGYKRKVRQTLERVFDFYDRRMTRDFAAQPTLLYNGFKEYERYRSLRSSVRALGEKNKLYFGCLYNVWKEIGGTLRELNRNLRDYISYRYVSEFERDNRDVLSALETFDVTVRDIGNLLSVKKDASRRKMERTLFEAFKDNILGGKKRNDMWRAVSAKRRQSVRQFVNKYGFWLLKGVRIWLMTPEAVSEVLPLEDGLFDLVIFDEASQVYVERGLPAIARAKKAVIAGDHKQLRPSSLGEGRMEYEEDEDGDDAALEEESLLDLARFRFPEIMLDYHYRSHYEELIAFSDYAFYKGKLKISPNLSRPSSPPIVVHKVKNGRWQDRRNAAEAKEVVRLLSQYLLDNSREETLGIITFNSAQRDFVQDAIEKECTRDPIFAAAYYTEVNRTENGEDVGLFVKNIENVQGDERDVIIFSVAYARNENGNVVRNYGWLNQVGGENRLNVAVSRAKKKIHLITSITPDELKVDDLRNDGPRIFKKYLEYAYAVSSGGVEVAKQVLASFGGPMDALKQKSDEFVLSVKEKLIEAGLDVESDVGMGSYRVDLAVKDGDGRYVLGLECDSSLYGSIASSRERDIHRRRYLEKGGWKIYRIWSSKWWHDPEGQIKNIKSAAFAHGQEGRS